MRILIAEDELDLAQALEALLLVNKYAVEMVHDGEDAVYYATSTQYDAIILDVMMPKKNGFEVIQELRQQGIATPVLMLTAKNQLEDKVMGLEYGADDYLTKPFETQELMARLKSLLRRPAIFTPEQLVFEDIQLDRSNFSLVCGQERVGLNNKEFQLLEYFMMNPNQVLSKEAIMEKVWGLDSDAEINVVWVNISSIRKKLQQVSSKVLIQLARGLGYQLVREND